MEFPNFDELIKYHNVFLGTGPFLLGVLAVSLYIKLKGRKKEPSDFDDHAADSTQGLPWVAILLIGLIGFSHFFGAYSSVLNAVRFRLIAPDEISAMTVQKVKNEGSPEVSQPVTLSDPEVIQQGLTTLNNAQSYRRNHEQYSDGYRCRLFLKGSDHGSDFYITAYRKSSRSGTAWVVIPHIGENHSGSLNHGGEYTSPEFGKWLQQNAIPLFETQEISLESASKQ